LLNAFCCKGHTRHKLVQLLLKQGIQDDETQMPDESTLSPLQAIIHWISQPASSSSSITHAQIQSMKFLKEILLVTFFSAFVL